MFCRAARQHWLAEPPSTTTGHKSELDRIGVTDIWGINNRTKPSCLQVRVNQRLPTPIIRHRCFVVTLA